MPREAPALCEAGTQWRAYELGMGKKRPCRISPDPRMTRALAPRTPRGTTAQVIPTLLSLARLRLPLHDALSVTEHLAVTF
jgi:hypothetical protein